MPSGETFTNTILTDNYRKAIYDQEPLLDQDDQGTTFGQLELLISDRQSILIIDDNKDMRAYIVRIFRDEYRIYEADNGDVGLFYAKKYVPDIIISDINMNGMDGITFCKLLKEDSILSHIPVILITGDANPTLELQGIQIGAVDFISKPFEKDLLIARVRNISRNKADLQKYFFNQVTLKNNSNVLSEVDRDFLYKCIVIIENNLLEDGFDVQTLADEMTMSYSNLYKRMKLITNGSVKSFMRFVRIRKSAELLINTNCNINEASLSVGINDIKYFRAHFVKIFGINPSEFTKKHRTSFRKNI
ncbi:response regulator [Pedobacter sp. P26]|uniref:response regulator n=1 Tax=Pedobacter sp. P26 TaxID=3423956 RepID=UPI003D677300